MEFKIGDLVRGTQNQKYGIANADMTLAEVTGVYDGMVMILSLIHIFIWRKASSAIPSICRMWCSPAARIRGFA